MVRPSSSFGLRKPYRRSDSAGKSLLVKRVDTAAPPNHLGAMDAAPPLKAVSAFDVFLAFLKQGLTAFGGPVAHLGYFRREFVERRGWVSETAFADLIALCHFLPGPASSQLGMAIGLRQAGLAGALAAFAGFTLPAAVAM